MTNTFLSPTPKLFGRLHRAVSAAETCRRVAPVARRIGVTRIADITGLDRLGIPTYSCVRPGALAHSVAGVSVTCGKGTSREQAMAGALMEAIEYACAEPGALPLEYESYRELSKRCLVLDPSELILPNWSPYCAEQKLYWVQARELLSGESIWVPANAVHHPFVPEQGRALILRGNTAGLASGNRLEEAVCHALAELIEHDAWSLCSVRAAAGCTAGYAGVRFSKLEGELAWLFECFERAGISLFVRDITSELGVPTYSVTSVEQSGLHYLIHGGVGTHLDPTIALIRAITETAQSRAADIQGSREDLSYLRGLGRVERAQFEAQPPWELADAERYESFPRPESTGAHDDIADDIRDMASRLRERGFARVLVVDLTRPELGVPVVRVIVPGLEHVGVDPYRVGPRARVAFQQRGATTQGEA